MTYTSILVDHSDAVCSISLNRPASRNSLNQVLRIELKSALDDAFQSPDVRAIVLRAEGKGFCAGADLTERLPGEEEDGFVTELIRQEYAPIIASITSGPKPVVGAINGAAAGIGMAIALSCDILVMASDSFMYSAFGQISLIPDGGLHWFLSRHVGPKRAYELIALSQKLDAEQCLSLGLANRVVPQETLSEQSLALAKQLTAQAPLTLKHSKQLLHKAANAGLAEIVDEEAVVQNLLLRSLDFQEGTQAFFSKRAASFQGK